MATMMLGHCGEASMICQVMSLLLWLRLYGMKCDLYTSSFTAMWYEAPLEYVTSHSYRSKESCRRNMGQMSCLMMEQSQLTFLATCGLKSGRIFTT